MSTENVSNEEKGNSVLADVRRSALEKLFEEIEEEVGNAYEVGHFHGRGKRSDDGWGIHFDNIRKKVSEYIDGHYA